MWEYVREAVNTLFHALSSQWKCECSHLHRPYLRLDAREVTQAGEILRFNLTLLSEPSRRTPSPWRCRSIEVNSRVALELSPPSTNSTAMPSGDERKQQKRVRMSDLVPRLDALDSRSAAVAVYSMSSTSKVQGKARAKPLRQTTDKTPGLSCLCRSLTNSSTFGKVALDDNHWRHQVSAVTKRTDESQTGRGIRNSLTSSSVDLDSGQKSVPLFEQLILASNHSKNAPTITVRQK
jgi:hypothetical protein